MGKAIRVVGYVRRFIHNARCRRTERRTDDLDLDELEKAKICLFKTSQSEFFATEIVLLRNNRTLPKSSKLYDKSPFIDNLGLLRVHGRLDHSTMEYGSRHPLILPKCHVSLLVVRFQHKIMKHAGNATIIVSLRNTYLILGLRAMVRQVRFGCLGCRRVDATAFQQRMAPLPVHRVRQAPVFGTTGVDHAGPLYCSDLPGVKLYILLFTCSVIRAIHLELVDSLNIIDTMLGFRRFVARRGLPAVVWSDNAQTFKAARREVKTHFGVNAPHWKYNAPRSPWWGGWWEIMVRPVKSSLKRTLGDRSLTRKELETCLHEIESIINSRPLTVIDDDKVTPLTPAHFLSGRPAGLRPEPYDLETTPAEQKLLLDQKLDSFWKRWSEEYVRELPHCRSSKTTGGDQAGTLTEGSYTLVREDNTPRMMWPVAVIKKLFPGRDGLVRAVEVKTKTGTYTRPVQRLHVLETACELHENVENDENPPMLNRPDVQIQALNQPDALNQNLPADENLAAARLPLPGAVDPVVGDVPGEPGAAGRVDVRRAVVESVTKDNEPKGSHPGTKTYETKRGRKTKRPCVYGQESQETDGEA